VSPTMSEGATSADYSGAALVRRIASFDELYAAWRLVAALLGQDDSHTRNGTFYARHMATHPEFLLVADTAAAEPVFDGGQLIGVLLAHAEPDYVWLGKLAVVPAWRGRGAGSALVARLEVAVAGAGYRHILLGANPDAEPFYARYGYQPSLLPTGPHDLPLITAAGRPQDDTPPGTPIRRIFMKTL
jgi:GNAT superfamily N-acetyltransferase